MLAIHQRVIIADQLHATPAGVAFAVGHWVGYLYVLSPGIDDGIYGLVQQLVPIAVAVLADVEVPIDLRTRKMHLDWLGGRGLVYVIVDISQPVKILDMNEVDAVLQAEGAFVNSPSGGVFGRL